MSEPNGPKLEISWADVRRAAYHGVDRQIHNMEQRNAPEYGQLNRERSPWHQNIGGAIAELAVARYLGIEWTGVVGPRARDTELCEVRWTHHLGGGLIFHPRKDNRDRPFALVVGDMANLWLPGWAWGHEIVGPRFMRRDWGNPEYCMPQEHLKHIDLLPRKGAPTPW